MLWQNNDKGPECDCGNPTVVKGTPNGGFVLLCFFHTNEDGCYFLLPKEKPEDWDSWTIDRVLELQRPKGIDAGSL